jgi:hypothetical protein
MEDGPLVEGGKTADGHMTTRMRSVLRRRRVVESADAAVKPLSLRFSCGSLGFFPLLHHSLVDSVFGS